MGFAKNVLKVLAAKYALLVNLILSYYMVSATASRNTTYQRQILMFVSLVLGYAKNVKKLTDFIDARLAILMQL
jgi:hypothetical protein